MPDAQGWSAALGERSDPLMTAVERSAMRRRSPSRRPDDGDQSEKRRDIQGLRALAVAAVVINHLTGHPIGGFVGVDVFFVISGYLITSHLLREFVTSQRISITGFYRKRIRRLFPAAIAVTVLTLLAARSVYAAARFHAALVDGAWATVFWANWHSISTGTNYFSAGLPATPFQHYWSLSVEEQYYVVWPIALFLAGVITVRLTRAAGEHQERVRMLGGIVLAGVMLVASLAYGLHLSDADPVRAYFSTFTRAWELGLGSLLACVVPFMRGSRAVLTAISWAGTAAIAVSVFVVHGVTGFPVPGAILPCLGAALVISAITPTARASNILLTNPASVYVGDISYSIYLVHFPVIVLLATKMPDRGPYFYATAVLLIVGLSVALYSAVERPILRSGWLLPAGESRRSRRTTRSERRVSTLSLGVSTLCVLGAIAALALWPGTTAQSNALVRAIAIDQANPSTTVSPGLPELQALSVDINAALRAEKWPALHPSIDSVMSGPKAPADMLPCGAIKLAPAERCTWGPPAAKHLAVLVGDSLSMAYAEAFKYVADHSQNWRVRVAGAFGCQFTTDVRISTVKSWQTACTAHNDQTISMIRQLRPDLVVITNSTGPKVDVNGHPLSDVGWTDRLKLEILRFNKSVRKIVILPPPPWDKQIALCFTKGSTPIDCVSKARPSWYARTHAEAKLSSALDGVFIDPLLWFCDSAGLCPSFVGTTPTKQDLEHPTAAYIDRIAPVMLEAFRAKGLFD